MYGFKTKTAKAISKWLEKNDFYCICKLDPKEFAYDLWDDVIFIPKTYTDEKTDPYFHKTLLDLGLENIDVSIYALSVLHEIGHAETLPQMDEFEIAFNNLKIMENEEKSYSNLAEGLFAYWNNPREKIANEWAVDFANNFPKETAELDKIVKDGLIVGEG